MDALKYFAENHRGATSMTNSECEARIKAEIERNRTYTTVIKMFGFQQPDDKLEVLMYYCRLLLAALPRKGRDYLQDLFDRADENTLVQWVEVIYKPKSNDDLEKLLEDAGFFKCIKDLKDLKIEISFLPFYETLRTYFCEYFIHRKHLPEILEIYQCLLHCNAIPSPNNPLIFCAAVKDLWKKCDIKGAVLNLEADETANVYPEHERLKKLVSNVEKTSLIPIQGLIKDLFQPAEISFITDGTKTTLKVEGYKVILSKVFNCEENASILENKDITGVQIFATNELILDQNLKLPGINFSCKSNSVVIPRSVKIDLSGNNAVSEISIAENGKEAGEAGADGKDGKAGQSSGNFALISQTVFGVENLKLILNGGDGGYGQNGGDGADGKDSVGIEFEKAFGLEHRIFKGIKQGANLLTGSLISRTFDRKIEKKRYDGSLEIHCDSPYYFSTHTFEFIKGPDGGKGGLGGKNGKGGQGGYRGTCHVEIAAKDAKNVIQVDAYDGKKGPDGQPGKNGDFGKEGWDIALINSTLGKRTRFGETHDKKLSYHYSATKTENSVYVHSKDAKKGSECFVEIRERDCIKKKLADTEQRTQLKAESERSGESIAIETADIDLEALKQTHKSNISLSADAQQDIRMEINEMGNIERVMDFYTDLEEAPYFLKKRHKTVFFKADDITDAKVFEGSGSFWKSTTDFSLENLFDKYDVEIQEKMKKKHTVFKLRLLKKDIAPMLSTEGLFTFNEIKSTDENDRRNMEIFDDIKNLEIDAKSFELHICDVRKAFQEHDVHGIKTLISKMAPFNLENKLSVTLLHTFQNDYEAMPEEIKKTNCQPMFCFFKLYESIKAFTLLQERRMNQATKFQEKIKKLEKKYNFESTLTDEEQSLDLKLQILFEYFEIPVDVTLYLRKEMQFLCEIFVSTGTTFLNSLLLIFEIEGCHIDVITLKYLVDTVFDACKLYESFNGYIFPSILLTTEQENWLDNFFIFNVESALKHRLKNKAELENILKQMEDENLKILCTEKLYESDNSITEEQLMALLDTIKASTNLYPQAKDITLKEWITKMQQINSASVEMCNRWNALDESSKRTVLFWCSMLSEKNLKKKEEINEVQEKLIDLLQYDRATVSRFMHRLCDDGNIVNKTKKPLKGILEAALHCLKSPHGVTDDTECFKVAKELLAPYPYILLCVIRREFDEIKVLCKNLNDSDAYNSILNDVLSLLSNFSFKKYFGTIDECAKSVLENDECEPSEESLFEKYKSKFYNIYGNFVLRPDLNQFYLEIVNKIIFAKRNFKLRHTQKIAVLCVLKDYDNGHRGLLQQIATGEGKTLIIAVVSIISALKGRKINIVTSSSVLAKRDASDPPHGCQDLYQAFGLKVDHICYDCPQKRQDIYSNCHIIYGDLTSYQRDYLLDEFYSAKIASTRDFDIMVVDEVDSLLLDNGLNTLYLSHNIADFEMLHSLIIHIWNLVNIHIKDNGNCKSESFYQKVYTSVFPVIELNDISKCFGITEAEAMDFRNVLIENKVIDINGTILITNRKELSKNIEKILENFEKFCSYFTCFTLQEAVELLSKSKLLEASGSISTESEAESFLNMLKRNKLIDESGKILLSEMTEFKLKLEELKIQYSELLNKNLIYKIDEIMEKLIVDVPEHMKFYVSTHLKEFIENGQTAYAMEVDVSYRIGMSTSFNEIPEPKIVITDRDTGVDLPTTQWHRGLHQFLQLKHGLRLTSLSTKAVFISNITYLQKFEKLYGFSGTLGAKGEKQQFQEFYKLKSILLPSSHIKQFYEEPSIITKTKEKHYKAIFDAIKEKLSEGRSILVISDSSKEVVHLNKNIKQIAEEKYCTTEKENLMPYKNAVVYQKDSEEFNYGKGTKLGQKSIIFATNLAGRGTDIILTDELKEKGGLHVIITFLPKNVRVEEQAFGRAARSGERGTAQLIICEKESVANISNGKNILELKWKRNIAEENRIRKIRERYENRIKVEEQCFEYFCKKFKEFKDFFAAEKESYSIKILSKDMLDNWALFLDKSEYVYKDNNERINAAKEFCAKLTIDKNKEPLQPLNMLNFAVAKVKEEKYPEALKLLKSVGSNFPIYLPEAQYYSVFITTKGNEERKQFDEAKKELSEARIGFTKRLLEYKEHIDIVESHKIIQENRCLHCDAFVQQQKESALLMKNVLESIDVFFGQMIEASAFQSDQLPEEAAMFLFEHFSNPSNYGNNLPIQCLKIKEDINEKNLKNYCKSNGLCFSRVITNLKDLQKSKNVTIKELQKIMEISTWETFWNELEEKNLLSNTRAHMFVDITKLPRLTASKIDRFRPLNVTKYGKLFQHLFVTKENWIEFDSNDVRTNIGKTLLNFLIKNKIICETKSGILTEEFEEISTIEFSQFSTITKDNLLLYDITEDEANIILDKLIDSKIIQKYNDASYCLLSKAEFVFVTWYENVIIKMIKQKLAFALAYQLLNKDKMNIDLNLLNKDFYEFDEKSFISELTDNGILEQTNINLDGLRAVGKDANIIREAWETMWETEVKHNISEALKAVQEFMDSNFEIFLNKKSLITDTNVQNIVNVFEGNAAISQKYSTFDISLIPIKKKYLSESDNSHLMITHGLSHLIEFHQKKWTKNSLLKSTAITAAGLAQLAGGVVLFTTIGGAIPGKIIAFEGVSDIIFGARGFFTGQSGNYAKHKMISIGLNVTTCSVTEALKFTKDATILKTMFSKIDVGANTAVNFLSQAVTFVAPSLLQIQAVKDKFSISQEATDFAVTEIQVRIKEALDEIFSAKSDGLQAMIKPLLLNLGINENDIKEGLFKSYIQPVLSEICYFMVAELRTTIIENKEINKEKCFQTRIVNILKSPHFEKLSESFTQKLETCINHLKDVLATKGFGGNEVCSDIDEITVKTKDFIQKWKEQIENESKKVLTEELKIPVNFDNEAEYQKQLDSIVIGAYSQLRRYVKLDIVGASEKNYQNAEECDPDKLLFAELKTNYYKKLNEIQAKTQSPEIFAAALNRSLNMDIHGAEAISNLIKNNLLVSVTLKTDSGILTSNGDVEIQIKQNYDAFEISSFGDTMYDQIINQLPAFRKCFQNKLMFEKALAEEINKNPTFFVRQKEICQTLL